MSETSEVPVELVQTLSEQIDTLLSVLETETRVMETRAAEALPSLVDNKNQLLSDLQAQEQLLIGLFTQYPEEKSVLDLKQQLVRCQQVNRQNQVIAQVELKHTQKSLSMLRSLLNLDDLSLYSSMGDLDIKREKRDLGSA